MADDSNVAGLTPVVTGDKTVYDEASIEAKETGIKNVFLWFSYDAADTYFSQLIISLAFTPYALLLGIKMGWSYELSFVAMSVFMATSNLLIAIMGPILGSLSDVAGKRKVAVLSVASIMVASTAAISAFNANFWIASSLFLVANFMYQAGRMFYDAQIPFIAKTEQRSFMQSVGGSISFVGSILAVVTSMVVGRIFGSPTHIDTAIWVKEPLAAEDIQLNGLRWMFLIGAIVIVIMTIPYLFHKEVENPSDITFKENFKQSLKAFRTTGKEIIKDRNSLSFFLGWFFITDAANTAILYMAVTIQGAVGYNSAVTNYVIFAGIGGCFLFAILTGIIMNKIGPKMTFIINGICWMIAISIVIFSGWNIQRGTQTVTYPNGQTIITEIYLTFPKWFMFIGAIFIGIGFGGIWIIGRQFIMELAPPKKLAQYGGFQKIAGRVSAILSPLSYSGLIMAFSDLVSLHHAYRIALGFLLLFFSIGIAFISRIIDPHEKYLKGERAPYIGIYETAESE